MGRIECIAEVLGFVRNLSIPKFHDAYRVYVLVRVTNRVFRNPQIALSYDSLYREPRWMSRMMASKFLQIVPAANDLARLRVLAHDIVVIDFVFADLIARGGCRPMPIDS